MDIGNFYFITDQYFVDFPDGQLMKNKEYINGIPHNRPCYYSFVDNKTGLYWAIPVSSQLAKFQAEHAKKVARSRHGECDTIHFAHVRGDLNAFLIQNMCPVTDAYINNQFIDQATGNPVIISAAAAAEIERKAKKVLMLQRNGRANLIFPDILAIEAQLLAKQTTPTPTVTPAIPTTTP